MTNAAHALSERFNNRSLNVFKNENLYRLTLFHSKINSRFCMTVNAKSAQCPAVDNLAGMARNFSSTFSNYKQCAYTALLRLVSLATGSKSESLERI